jgi:hypothetical protein
MVKYSLRTLHDLRWFKMAIMMNKLAMINSCEIILEALKNNFFAKNHCEIQVGTILVCALYPIKYGTFDLEFCLNFLLKFVSRLEHKTPLIFRKFYLICSCKKFLTKRRKKSRKFLDLL